VSWANQALLKLDKSQRAKLLEKVAFFCDKIGMDNPGGPIVIIEYKNVAGLLQKKQELINNNILVGAIRPPTAKTARLRITISLRHSNEDLEFLANLL
jgi:7-keto-8-aminopelargonate synthetase-like enzyme